MGETCLDLLMVVFGSRFIDTLKVMNNTIASTLLNIYMNTINNVDSQHSQAMRIKSKVSVVRVVRVVRVVGMIGVVGVVGMIRTMRVKVSGTIQN